MKRRLPVFSSLLLLLTAVLAVLCTGCMPRLIGSGGEVVLASDSSAVLFASTVMSPAGYLCYASQDLYTIERYDGEGRWIALRYNDTLGVSSGSSFWFGGGEKNRAFFRCGQYLLFLTEYRGNDSLKLIARRFDMMGKLVGKANTLLAMEERTDAESADKGSFFISLSPDSSHFAVTNYSYREVRNTENFTATMATDMFAYVFNEDLAITQSKEIPAIQLDASVTMGVSNAGELYMVQYPVQKELFVQRVLSDKEVYEMHLPISWEDSTVKPEIQSVVMPFEHEKEWYVFSVVSTPGLEKTVSLVIHSCDWNTGKARIVANYLLDEAVARSVVNDNTMGNMVLNNVVATPQGFIFWLEASKKDYVQGSNASGRVTYEPMQELGPICLFSFATDGTFRWQKGIIRNLRLYQNVFAPQRCSDVAVVGDNLHVTYGNTNQSRRITYNMGHAFITADVLSSATGEIMRHSDILYFDGAAFWTRRDIGWSTPTIVTIPCYEESKQAVNIVKLQIKE